MAKQKEFITEFVNPQDILVESLEGIHLVDAGAGTGKTHTIIRRYNKLIESGVKPEEILLITFTNVAAMQMNNAGNEWTASNMAAEMNPEKHQLIYSANSNHELIRKDVLKSCSMIYVFVNAAMKMGDYQQELLENWKSLNIPMQAILINTKINHLENYIGEIPKERSKLRKRIKDIVWRYSK